MKPYFSDQIVVTLAGIACLCVLIFLSLNCSPAFAAALSRGADLGIALAVRRSPIYPFCAIKNWLPLVPGTRCACRWIKSFPCLDWLKEIKMTILNNNSSAPGRSLAATTILLGTLGFLCGFLLALTLAAYSLYSCIRIL